VKIEYNEAKLRWTLDERKLDFEDAAAVMADVHLTRPVETGAFGEQRFFTLGKLRSEIVVLVWTPRGDATRMISMRTARRSERKVYKEYADRSR
jgi:uncharacterized DUF497 family protein